MIDLRIYFAGLVVFGRKGDDGRDLHALLVDARRPGRVPGTEGVRPHLPALLFNEENFDPGKNPDIQVSEPFKDIAGKAKRYVTLNKDFLRLAPGQETVEKELSYKLGPEPPVGIPQTAESACDLQWLAPLQDARGEAGRLKEGLLNFGGALDAKRPLVASVILKAGTVEPCAFAAQRESFITWTFAGDGGPARTIAAVVEYRVELPTDTARLELLRFDRSRSRIITFEKDPAAGAADPRLEIWVMNLEPEIVQQKRPPGPVARNARNPEYLFFFELLRDGPGSARIPVTTTFVPPGLVHPAFRPCREESLRQTFFPRGGGELALSSPCSPAHAQG